MPPAVSFLSLPGEIRSEIYTAALAPTASLTLTQTAEKRFATHPQLSPKLLQTCRQIHREAQNFLYKNNTISLSINASETSWPVIAEARLPQKVLEKLEKLFIVLDCSMPANYANGDWKAFSAMVALKELRVTIVEQSDWRHVHALDMIREQQRAVMGEILTRVSGRAVVRLGTDSESEERGFVEQVARICQRRFRDGEVVEMSVLDLEGIMRSLGNIERGEKSGTIDDVFAEYREDYPMRYLTPDLTI